MSRTRFAIIAVALVAIVATIATGQSDYYRSAEHDYRIVTVAEGLEHPWSIAFLPGGDILVTERPGRLRIIRDGELLDRPVAGVPEVLARGQGGLMEVAPHPDFADNRLLYLTYSKPTGERSATTALLRARFENDALTGHEELFVAVSEGNGHYGSKIAFDGNGHLFVTVGDRQVPPRGDLYAHPAQDISNHHGTINRLYEDGRIPEDNPFVDVEGARPEIWSYGHRNAQGLVVHPDSGEVWATEHGPQGGDEVNLIEPGANYGWPVVGFGVNYRSGLAIHKGTHEEGTLQPAFVWVPSIGTSGLMVYTGDAFPRWRGDMFAGGMSGDKLVRLVMDGNEILYQETLAYGVGRVRDVRQGPDGFVYLAIDGERDGPPTPVVRLEPVN